MKTYREKPWIDPRIEVRKSPIEGTGMFATQPIAKGDVVIITGGILFTREDVESMVTGENDFLAIGDNLYLGHLHTAAKPDDDYINHSCDPNTWLIDEVTFEARRDIQPGEELTIDYAMFLELGESLAPFKCNCGVPGCRDVITDHDWDRPELQERYGDHFSPFINRRIERIKQGLPPVP